MSFSCVIRFLNLKMATNMSVMNILMEINTPQGFLGVPGKSYMPMPLKLHPDNSYIP